jgi:O-antigen/teichoic acid export membrane protein
MRLISGILVGIWMARYLGPESFGVFSFAISFVAILGPIAKLGLDHIVVQDLTRNPDKRDEYIGTAFWLKVIGALLLLILIIIAVQFSNNDDTTNLYIFIIAIGVVFQSFDVVDFYFQSKVLNKYVSICKFIQLGISSLLKIALILSDADLIWFIIVTLIDNATLAMALFVAYLRQNLGYFWGGFNINIAKKMLAASWTLALTSYATMLFLHMDKVMVNQMHGAEAVGYYSAAVKISEAYYFIPLIIATSLFPAIINSKKISESLYLERLLNLHVLLAWLAISIAVVITFIGKPLVLFLFGAAYAPAGQVLVIHVWAGVFVALSIASKRWFIVEGFQHLILIRAVTATACNIILNLFLIPRYGIVGAAISTLISLSLETISYLFNSKLRIIFLINIKSLFPLYLFRNKKYSKQLN